MRTVTGCCSHNRRLAKKRRDGYLRLGVGLSYLDRLWLYQTRFSRMPRRAIPRLAAAATRRDEPCRSYLLWIPGQCPTRHALHYRDSSSIQVRAKRRKWHRALASWLLQTTGCERPGRDVTANVATRGPSTSGPSRALLVWKTTSGRSDLPVEPGHLGHREGVQTGYPVRVYLVRVHSRPFGPRHHRGSPIPCTTEKHWMITVILYLVLPKCESIVGKAVWPRVLGHNGTSDQSSAKRKRNARTLARHPCRYMSTSPMMRWMCHGSSSCFRPTFSLDVAITTPPSAPTLLQQGNDLLHFRQITECFIVETTQLGPSWLGHREANESCVRTQRRHVPWGGR